MHHGTTKDLFDMLPSEDKGDFLHAYLYLKYLDQVIYEGVQGSGGPCRKPSGAVEDEVIQDLLTGVIQEIGEGYFNPDTNVYHSKIVQLKDAIALVTQKENIKLSLSEKVVPFRIARDVILTNPESIAVGSCPCRSVAEQPCLPDPMEVCLIVGDPAASFIAEHNPKYRKISQEEAITVLEDAHRRGEVHSAYFKKHLGNRFYAICNCCSCCCFGVKMFNLMQGQSKSIGPSGYVAEVSEDCNGCAACVEACPFHAMSMDEGSKMAAASVEKCMGCGVCESACVVEAISLRLEPSKGEPLDIECLKQAAA